MSAATLEKPVPATLSMEEAFGDAFGMNAPAPALSSAPKRELPNLSAPPVRTEPDAQVLEKAGVELGDGAATREASLVRQLRRLLAAEHTLYEKNESGKVFTEADMARHVDVLFSVLYKKGWCIWPKYPVCSADCGEAIAKAKAEVEARLLDNEARAARMIAQNATDAERHKKQMENRQ